MRFWPLRASLPQSNLKARAPQGAIPEAEFVIPYSQNQTPNFNDPTQANAMNQETDPSQTTTATPEQSGTPGSNRSWGGRFEGETDAFVQRFTASVDFDQRLYAEDIQGSIAHARMLANVGILTEEEVSAIVTGLEEIRAQIASGEFEWSVALEDVHMNVEAALVARIGDTGKKLHTGRSRNDQVATDVRLYVRGAIDSLRGMLDRLMHNIVDLAEREHATILPGFTHLQAAQPITFGHHLLAWCEMLLRDRDRLIDCRKRVNVSPLGAAALAGTTFPIDRDQTAAALGFDGVCANSLDAVSDRDFAIEFVHCCAVLMMHLSRMAEEMVIWNSQQVSFVELPDAFCTGSSIMPQKKNPDVPELVRGKTGRVYGHLTNLLTLMKGQPLAYNKDNQEDKEPLFDAADSTLDCVRAFRDLIPGIEVNRARMRAAAADGFTTATDLADYLVRRGLPFRDAHEVVGRAVKLAITQDCALEALPLESLAEICPRIEADVFDVLTLEGSVSARNHYGATAPEAVLRAVAEARRRIEMT